MKKTFVYELKRCLLPLVIFSAIAVVVSLIAVLGFSTRSASSGEYRLYRLDNAGIDVFTVLLCILCTVVPVMQFSYRMGQRSTDLWYSLPVSRRRLALVRVLVGLVMVFVPYTLAYLFGVLTIALRVTQESFVWYVPHFFLSLLLGAGLFGVNSFLFSRANRVMDGILFIAAWACILPLFLALVSGWADDTIFSYMAEGRTRSYKVWNACDSLFTYSPLAWTSAFFERLVVAKQPLNDGMCVNFALAVAVGVAEMAAAYTLLFICADRDKSENADQISSSWWGYKVLIPAYLALAVAVLRPDLLFGGVDWWMVLVWVVLLVLALVLYFAYRRSFRLKKRDVIALAASFAGGVLVVLLTEVAAEAQACVMPVLAMLPVF